MKEWIGVPVCNVTCDMCGKDCRDSMGANEFMSLDAHWGFSTKHDTEKWTGEFCEKCSDKILALIQSVGGKIRVESIYSDL
jgi:hypothetical protein